MIQQFEKIRHSVIFSLKHPQGSEGEKLFFTAANKLSSIPGVENFECLRQVSKKNKFTYGISMEFAKWGFYEKYNNHPDHVAFIEEYWMRDVDEFLEIDFQMDPHLNKSNEE